MSELETAVDLVNRVLSACSCWGEIEGASGGVPITETDRADAWDAGYAAGMRDWCQGGPDNDVPTANPHRR